MGAETSIGWTAYRRVREGKPHELVPGYTFNAWWGCEKVSPACAHCYAESWAKRTGHEVWGKASPRRFFGPKHWDEPVKWNAKAEREGTRPYVFCMSMGDVFERHADLIGPRLQLWPLVRSTPRLTWLLLTKRPENVTDTVPLSWKDGDWPANAWLGVTAEDQEHFVKRWRHLQEIPAPVRFLSCEPLLGPILLPSLGTTPQPDWVIVGGESGAHARLTWMSWIEDLRYQCERRKIPLFVKQLGQELAQKRLPIAEWRRDRKGERLESLPEGLRIRQWPDARRD